VSLHHDTEKPDVETASDGYAGRFSGPLGEWLLSVQARAVEELLALCGTGTLDVLEVGGGHAQLTPSILSRGHRVTVQASARHALRRHAVLARSSSGRLRLVVSRLWRFPCRDRSFDVVVGVRLLAHVERWQELLREMARVTRRYLIIDYPPLSSANVLTPVLFWAKRRVERNTRPYFCYRVREVESCLRRMGFSPVRTYRQFAVPMGVHRAIDRVRISSSLEALLGGIGVTRVIGSPAVLLAVRENGHGGRAVEAHETEQQGERR
jgi:SAM-dependent methyltransferase